MSRTSTLANSPFTLPYSITNEALLPGQQSLFLCHLGRNRRRMAHGLDCVEEICAAAPQRIDEDRRHDLLPSRPCPILDGPDRLGRLVSPSALGVMDRYAYAHTNQHATLRRN